MRFFIGQLKISVEKETFVVLPGDYLQIEWKISGINISNLLLRQWLIVPQSYMVAQIVYDGRLEIGTDQIASKVDVIRPSTLVLKNIDRRFNGTYRFFVSDGTNQAESYVSVFVAGKYCCSVTREVYISQFLLSPSYQYSEKRFSIFQFSIFNPKYCFVIFKTERYSSL